MTFITRHRQHNKGRLAGLAALTCVLPGLAAADITMAADNDGIPAETDTYRVGHTYQSMRSSGLQACAAACAEDQRCAAWSITPPTFRIGPRCELKSSAGQGQPRAGYVSGLSADVVAAQQAAAAPQTSTAVTAATSPPVERREMASSSSVPPNEAAVSHLLPTPVGPSVDPTPQTPTQVSRARRRPAPEPEQVTSTPPPSATETPKTVRPSPTPAPLQSRPPRDLTTRPVQPPVADAVTETRAPASAAQPQQAPASDVTSRPPSPAPGPSTTPSQVRPDTPADTATAPQSRGQQAVQPALPRTRPLPSRPNRPALPTPRERGGPAYSVQKMGDFPGDYDATAGYVDGLPENARVEPIQRDEDDASAQSASDNDGERESRNDDWEGYPEYPDPLGGPIGSADEDDD